MQKDNGNLKPLAYAVGAAVALHAVGIGGYLMFRSKPTLADGPVGTTLPACRGETSDTVGKIALETYEALPKDSDMALQGQVVVSYTVRNEKAAVTGVSLQQTFLLSSDSVNLAGLHSEKDCEGWAEAVLKPVITTGKPAVPLETCPPDINAQVYRQSLGKLTFDENELLMKSDSAPDHSHLSVHYEIRDGKGSATWLARKEYRTLKMDDFSLDGLPLQYPTACSGHIIKRFDRY